MDFTGRSEISSGRPVNFAPFSLRRPECRIVRTGPGRSAISSLTCSAPSLSGIAARNGKLITFMCEPGGVASAKMLCCATCGSVCTSLGRLAAATWR